MQLLANASPRFLSLFLGAFAVTLLPHHYYPRNVFSRRLYFVDATAVVAVILSVSSIVGLVSLSSSKRVLITTEFILEEMARLGLYWTTAFLLHPTTLEELLSHSILGNTTQSLVVWLSGTCATMSCLFDGLGYFRPGPFFYISIAFAICTSALISVVFIRIGTTRNLSESVWLLLLLCQIFSIVTAVGRTQLRNGTLYIAGRFCLLGWTAGMLALVHKLALSDVQTPSSLSNRPRVHSKRRMVYPSASEDFRSYRDPFAGPLALRENPMTTYSSFYPIPVQHSVVSLSVSHPYSRPIPTELAGFSSTEYFQSIHGLPIARESGTDLGYADISNAGSFHTAEGYWDASPPEEDGTVSNKKASVLTSGTVPVCLPSIPVPAHVVPSFRQRAHERLSHQGSLDTTAGSLPLTSHSSEPTFVLRTKVRGWTSSIDRTPTQSLYVSSTSLDASILNTNGIPDGQTTSMDSVTAAMEQGNARSQSTERVGLPSLESIPSIPSLPGTPLQSFEQTELTLDDSILLTDALDISEVSERDSARSLSEVGKTIESKKDDPVIIISPSNDFTSVL